MPQPQQRPYAINVMGSRGQCMLLVLAAVHEMGGSGSKQQALGHIQGHGWFAMIPEDLTPYPSHIVGNNEPRWHTMIAFGRQECVIRDLMFQHDENDIWDLTRKGVDRFKSLREAFARGKPDVREGYLWAPAFKRWLHPAYTPSERDLPRPKSGPEGPHDVYV